jgi:hypothetical protein
LINWKLRVIVILNGALLRILLALKAKGLFNLKEKVTVRSCEPNFRERVISSPSPRLASHTARVKKVKIKLDLENKVCFKLSSKNRKNSIKNSKRRSTKRV